MASSFITPQVIASPFAWSGDKATLPADDTSGTGVASIKQGIPSECSQDLTASGKSVRRSDVNALGYLATSTQFFLQNGGSFTFDADVATAIGGYPAGALLWYTNALGETNVVKSLINNNSYNFVTTPSYIDGVNWVYVLQPYEYSLKRCTKLVGDVSFTNNVWKTLDLSSHIGAAVTMVHLKVDSKNSSCGVFCARTFGDVEAPAGYLYSQGVRGGTVWNGTPTHPLHIQVITDASGKIDVLGITSAASIVTITIEAYQKMVVI